jgi:3'-phosphoadenosine 5'-phosphosulfate sulfotransferase (PAPS reductase)/FAD synthetase
MSNPFLIDGPTSYAFSFGRTSGYGLRRVLDANPPEVLREYLRPFSANTGKEHPESLAFGERIDREWLRPLGLSITLLEYRQGPSKDEPHAFKQVTFETASRNGEPFEALIRQRFISSPGLPNAVMRYCSSEMKTRTMHRYIRQVLGWDEWDTILGIRADEPSRYVKFRSNPHPETKAETVRVPLVQAGIGAQDVGNFWRGHPLDLNLPNINGKTYHGNCDLCYLKHPKVVAGLIAENPKIAEWWIAQEDMARAAGAKSRATFADDRDSYKTMHFVAKNQMDFVGYDLAADLGDGEYESIPCGGWCGTDV